MVTTGSETSPAGSRMPRGNKQLYRINARCTCSKSAANSLFQVVILRGPKAIGVAKVLRTRSLFLLSFKGNYQRATLLSCRNPGHSAGCPFERTAAKQRLLARWPCPGYCDNIHIRQICQIVNIPKFGAIADPGRCHSETISPEG